MGARISVVIPTLNGGVLFTSSTPTVRAATRVHIAALLALSPRVLYAHHAGGELSPLEDQHLGGAIMILVGGISYLAGGLWLTVVLLRGRMLQSKEAT